MGGFYFINCNLKIHTPSKEGFFNMNTSEMVPSTGLAGEPDYYRSEGRVYLTEDRIVDDPEVLTSRFTELLGEAESRGRRRTVLRARVTSEVADAMTQVHPDTLEVNIPLSVVDPTTSDSLVVLGSNVHEFPISEWSDISSYWGNRNGRARVPQSFLDELPDRFRLTPTFEESDIPDLEQLWLAFGWSPNGINQLRQNIGSGKTFSGVRDIETGRIVSATMGEVLSFAGVNLAETTEYATNPAYRGHNLCTASVIGLTAQLLDDLQTSEGVPLVMAELNMTSRSDVVAYHAGMTIPGVEHTAISEQPRQVLRANVSVLDGQAPNSLNWRDLPDRDRRRQAFAFPHRYLRNFVVGVLPRTSMDAFYSPAQRAEILSHYSR